MKKIYTKAFAALVLGASVASCGDGFLDAEQFDGVDLDKGLSSVTNIGFALNGTYYNLYRYYFAGNYSTNLGDVGSDISYWNAKTNHFYTIYQFSPNANDVYLGYIWEYGYKVADNSARIIKAGKNIIDGLSEDEKAELNLYMAEAYALRAYSQLVLVNVFGHQVKVNGEDFSSSEGIVVIDEPIPSGSQVKRGTVGEAYTAILSDLNNSLACFQAAGGDGGSKTSFTIPAVYGLMARANLYMENYSAATTAAAKAIELSGVTELATTTAAYKALYKGGPSNTESLFYLAINSTDNWSANAAGNIWSSYDYTPSPYLQSLMASTDVRTSVWEWTAGMGPDTGTPQLSNGGKFGATAYGPLNAAFGTCYLINIPEMYLIQAECALRQASPNVNAAKSALLHVAKRNTAITTVDDLPSTADDLMAFVRDERARELFQEGHRLWDLRRWDVMANLYAFNAPNIDYMIKNFKVSNVIYPIPADEINAGYGVTQTEDWSKTFPTF